MMTEEVRGEPANPLRAGLGRALLAIALVCRPSIAAADEADSRREADALFYEARELASEGKYQRACAKFERAHGLSPGIGILFNLADCLEHIGRTASAWEYFMQVASLSLASGQLEREAVARERAARLEPNLARLTIDVPLHQGLEIKRDGVVFARSQWGTPMPVDPGEHFVEARAPGMIPRKMKIEVPVGPMTVELVIPPLELVNPPREPEAVTSVQASTTTKASAPEPAISGGAPSTAPRTVGIVLAGVGGAALGAAAVFGGLAVSKNQQALDMCVNYDPALGRYRCNSQEEVTRHDELVEEARLAQRLCVVGIAGSVASLTSAAVLLFSASPRGKPNATVGLLIDGQQLGLGMRGAF